MGRNHIPFYYCRFTDVLYAVKLRQLEDAEIAESVVPICMDHVRRKGRRILVSSQTMAVRTCSNLYSFRPWFAENCRKHLGTNHVRQKTYRNIQKQPWFPMGL